MFNGLKITAQLKKWEELNTRELYSILQLRTAVFVVEQNCPYQECDGKDVDALHFYYQHENDGVVAYVRLLPPGVSYEEPAAGRVVVHRNYRNRGWGKQIMQQALKLAREQFKTDEMRISAQLHLVDFYGQLGFQPIGEDYLEDGIPHIQMVLMPKG